MRFLSSMTSITYVIRPGWNEIDPVTRQPIRHRALQAEFRRHSFDSEIAARSLGWTPEDHELVVNTLNDPPEGTGPYDDRTTGRLNVDLDAHPDGHNFGPGGERVTVPPKPCLFTIVSAEGASLCSKPAVTGEEYCTDHLAALHKQVSMAKARDAKGAKVEEPAGAVS